MLNILLEQNEVVNAFLQESNAEILEGYVTEMLRLDPPLQGIYREARTNEIVGSTSVKAGDLVYLHITTANMNVSSTKHVFRFESNSQCASGACVRTTH